MSSSDGVITPDSLTQVVTQLCVDDTVTHLFLSDGTPFLCISRSNFRFVVKPGVKINPITFAPWVHEVTIVLCGSDFSIDFARAFAVTNYAGQASDLTDFRRWLMLQILTIDATT